MNDIFFKMYNSTTLNPVAVSIAPPSGYSYSAAAPVSGTYWNQMDGNTTIAAGAVAAGTTQSFSANNFGSSVVDAANHTLSGVTISMSYTAVGSSNGKTLPYWSGNGENTIQPGSVMQQCLRDYNGGSYYTVTVAGLPASKPFDLYIYGATTGSGQGTTNYLAAANVLGANPNFATTPNTTAPLGAIFTGSSPNYSLVAKGTTWNLIHGQSDASGNFVINIGNAGGLAYYNGFQLVQVPISYSATGGGSDCSSVAVGLSGSETGVSYQLYKNGTAVGSPVSGTGAAISFGNQTSSGTYTVVGTITDGTTTGMTNTMAGNAVVTILAPTTVSAATVFPSSSASVGANVTISVTTGGTAPTTYIWTKDGVTLSNGGTGNGGSTYSGATTATLAINNVQLGDAATSGHGYTCTVSGGCGSPTSAEATLTVSSGNTSPTISGVTNQTVLAGNSATLAAAVGGTPTPSLQWYLSTDGGSSSNAVAGATGSSITLTNVQYSQNGNKYYLYASNSVAIVVSNMTLTVTQIAPTIGGLTNQTVNAGFNATLGATVSGAPAPTLQWLVNGASITSATNTSLTLTNVHGSKSGCIYSLVAANTAGTVTNSMTLTVTNLQLTLNLDISAGATYDNGTAASTDTGTHWNHLGIGAIANAIDSFGNVTACGIAISGNNNGWNNPTASLGNPNPVNLMGDYLFNGPQTVTITNLPQGNYTLFAYAHGDQANQNSTVTVNGSNGGASGTTATTGNYRDIYAANAAGNSYLVLNGNVGSSGTFVFVSSGYLNGFQLQFDSPAGVSGLTNQTVVAGTTATLNPIVTGTVPLSYQWLSNSVALPDATNATLVLNNVQYAQNGTVYSLVASNVAGADTNSMTLTVIVTPAIAGLNNQAAAIGDTVIISPTVSGVPTPSLQWRFNGNNLTDGATGNGSTVSGSTSSALTIVNGQPADSGTYSLIASNSAGLVTNSMTLTVSSGNVAPTITGPVNQTAIQGSNATFTVSVSGLPVPDLQWLDQTGTPITGATSSSLTLTNVQYSQNGYTYSLVASNAAGVLTNSATLTVLVPVSISGQPQNTVVTNTQSASFTVVAGGVPAPSYQWYYNGAAIPSANSSTYTIASAVPANMGNYQVVISNSVNVVTSSVATLTVNSTMSYSSLTPANGATGVCYDTPLYLTFNATPKLRTAGKIRIYNITNSVTPVDTMDLSLSTTNDPTYGVNVQAYTIAGMTVTNFPVIINGTTAAIYPHQGLLTSNQTYYVTVDNGTFADNTGAYFAGITATNAWRFTTKIGGPLNATNLVVAQDYSGDFATVQGAVNFVPSGNTMPTAINIRNGTYTEIVNINSRNNLDLRGQSRNGVLIGYPNNNNLNPGAPQRSSFIINGNDCTLETLTVTNMTPVGGGQAEAVDVEGTRAIFYNMEMDSHQDTFLVHYSGKLVYFQDSLVAGDTDFLWGYGTVYFTNCELRSYGANLTQPRNPVGQRGFGFMNCRVTKANAGVSSIGLGRTFGQANAQALFAYCLMDDAVTGFGDAGSTNTADYACSNLTASVSKSLANSVHLTGSEPDAIAVQSAVTWLYGWQPNVSPNILSQPIGQAVTHGQTANFTVSATGTPSPAYQWLLNGTPIPGATSPNLAVANATRTNAGSYSVVVSNSSGSITSAVAALTYNNTAPTAQTQTVSRTAGLSLHIAISDLSTAWNDADGDSVALSSVSLTTTNGINLATNGGWILYPNSPNVNDQISYSISDGFGGTNIGYINIVVSNSIVSANLLTGIIPGTTNLISAYGIPNYAYVLQRSTNLSPAVWIDISTNTAGNNGVIHASDSFYDLGNTPPASAYYRLKYQP